MKASTSEVTSSDMVPNKAYLAFPIRNAMLTEWYVKYKPFLPSEEELPEETLREQPTFESGPSEQPDKRQKKGRSRR